MFTFHIPDVDPYTLTVISEFARWIAANIITLSIIVNLLQWMKKKAIQSNNSLDDKIITWLLSFFTFGWFTSLTRTRKTDCIGAGVDPTKPWPRNEGDAK